MNVHMHAFPGHVHLPVHTPQTQRPGSEAETKAQSNALAGATSSYDDAVDKRTQVLLGACR